MREKNHIVKIVPPTERRYPWQDASKKTLHPRCLVCGSARIGELSFNETWQSHTGNGIWEPIQLAKSNRACTLLFCYDCSFMADVSFFGDNYPHPELKEDEGGCYIELPVIQFAAAWIQGKLYIKQTTSGLRYIAFLRVANAKNVNQLTEALAAYDDDGLRKFGKRKFKELTDTATKQKGEDLNVKMPEVWIRGTRLPV